MPDKTADQLAAEQSSQRLAAQDVVGVNPQESDPSNGMGRARNEWEDGFGVTGLFCVDDD